MNTMLVTQFTKMVMNHKWECPRMGRIGVKRRTQMDAAAYLLLLVVVLVTGCASVPSDSVSVPNETAGPGRAMVQYVPRGASTGAMDTYRGGDGKMLAYLTYTSLDARVALVSLNGLESHSGWFAAVAEQLNERGYDVYCLDRRGSGLNRESRGFVSGDVDSYETLFDDLQVFIRPLRSQYDAVYLIGLSWGGKLALAYGLTNSDDIDGLVMITPSLDTLSQVDITTKGKILSYPLFKPKLSIEIPIEPEMITTTPRYLEYIRDDPMRLTSVSPRFLYESYRLDKYIKEKIQDSRLLTQLFLAGQDAIINNDHTLKLTKMANETTLDVVIYGSQSHSIPFDAPNRLAQDMDGWFIQRIENLQPY